MRWPWRTLAEAVKRRGRQDRKKTSMLSAHYISFANLHTGLEQSKWCIRSFVCLASLK